MDLKNKILVTVLVTFSVFITSLLGVTIIKTVGGNEFVLHDNHLVLSGQFNQSIELEDSQIMMSSDPINISMRLSGTSTANSLTGKFNIQNDSTARCVIADSASPYIIIVSEGQTYYLNCKTEEQTLELFEEIKALA